MSDDILNRIDVALERNRLRFDPLGGEVWDQDRVERLNDSMRVRPARAGIEEGSVPGEAAAEPRVFLDPGERPGFPYRCRGCRLWMRRDVKLCGPCAAAPPCRAERSAAEWDRPAVCFRPAGHAGQHESVEGRCWIDPLNPVEALRPGAVVTIATPEEAAEATRRFRIRSLECGALTTSLRCSGCDGTAMEGGGVCFHECHDWLGDADQPEPVPPHVDELLKPAPTARRPWWKRWPW